MSHQSELISEDILAYLAQHERKELLRFLTCGNVDDGKSTLIGRLLFDSKGIFADQLAAVSRSKHKRTVGDTIETAAAAGLVAATALAALVAQAPTDPYFADSLQAWEQGRFIRFHGLAQWVGWLWPFATLGYVLAALSRRPRQT